LHKEAVAVVQSQRALLDLLGQGQRSPWIFPAQHDASKPVGRDTIQKLWARLAVTADVPSGQRYGWHSFRRAFANRHRSAPLRDLQDLGGWKTHQTLLSVYLRPDEDAQRAVLEGQVAP
jgi:integrase